MRWFLLLGLTGCTTIDTGDSQPDTADTADTGAPDPATRRVGSPPLAEGVTLRGAGAGDRFGAAASGGDLDGDGVAELVVGAPGAAGGLGAAYVFAGPLTADVDAAGAAVTIAGNGALGWSVAVVGDLDGDGLADLAVGAPHADGGASGSGAAYVWRGPVASASTAEAWLVVEGAASGDALGARVADGGDPDADGSPDLLVGAWLADGVGPDAGGAGLFAGVAGTVGVDGAAAWFAGSAGGDWAGYGAAGAADGDGDGRDDLVLGADGLDGAGNNGGGAYFVPGLAAGGGSLDVVGTRYDAEGAGDNAGHAVAWAPDTDGDGVAELLVGALANGGGGKRAGAAYLFAAGAAGRLGTSGVVLRGTAGDHLGYSVAGLGDTDGDGFGDILLGARFDDGGGADAGAAWLLYGPVDATMDTAATALHPLGGAGEEAGFTVGAGGDLDGDGRVEGVVGAPAADAEAGRVYVVRGVTP